MDGTQVYLLWHFRHLLVEEDGSTIHLDTEGNIYSDEEESRLLGFFRSEQDAVRCQEEARRLPGFREEPDCFAIYPQTLDDIERYRELPGFRETPARFAVHPYVLDRPCRTKSFRIPGPANDTTPEA
ncbi:hypothetical protein AB0A71_19940 [Kitasatospora aureofaciens]|uniref:hypothetical protein n=1 Tax=Kitasatospora aureofaciens TaxID=1894 RepID=UPI0033CF7E60